MKRRWLTWLLLILFFPAGSRAQSDSIRIMCPLNDATVVPPSKNVIHYDPADLCVVLVSNPDTVVKACIAGKITNVEASSDEEGGWDVVLFCKYKTREYYFWYSGLSNVSVRRNDELKTGQPIGTIRPGGKIELLMYDFETQVDPTNYMDCKRVVSQ